MSSCLVVQTIPESLMKYYDVSQAAYNFCSGISSLDSFEEVVSLVPVNVIEDVSPYKSVDNKTKYFQIPLHLSTNSVLNAFGLILINYRLAKYLKFKKNIWYYNFSPSNFLSVIFLYIFFGKRVYLILADYTPTKKFFSIQYLIGLLVRNTIGIIALSGRTNFRHKNIKVIPGYTHGPYSFENIDISNITSFLIGGRLNESTGIDIAINVFKNLPHLKLFISGNLNEFWKRDIQGYDNIIYLGNICYEEYLRIFKSVPAIFSLRNPKFKKNNNNFPSKILEAFKFGKIVISTMRYDEIEGLFYFTCEYNEYNLGLMVKNISGLNSLDLQKCYNNIYLLEQKFGQHYWNKSIIEVENFI